MELIRVFQSVRNMNINGIDMCMSIGMKCAYHYEAALDGKEMKRWAILHSHWSGCQRGSPKSRFTEPSCNPMAYLRMKDLRS